MIKNEIIQDAQIEKIDTPSDRIYWIYYKDTSLLVLDYSTISSNDQALKVINESTDYICSLGKEKVRILVDVRESYADKKILEALKESNKRLKPFIYKDAVVGVTRTQDVFLKMINLKTQIGIKTFKTVDEAKTWLVS